ncbi:MAG: Gluconate 5-dehydrogenase [uncultured Acetobacteraceae bacterium]|uniref:NADP-dependent 3-hydroxy acid dehydrogenase YdfG n=1 Tax=uncultured Acetobacteraceae bacterium TaxID=169975 RepID=A0A6J4JKQ4_9PROT|nr:MAG: Gluconate 5-dehydrogenase [uncultured Acetobacteraceae bacterium]
MTQNSTALVTGASSGIGAVYADRLARRGHDLVLVARDRARLDALAARLARDTGRRIEVLPADLTDAADLSRVEARLRADAAIAMLVNNAGMSASGTLATADLDRLETMVRLNTIAPMRLAAAAVSGFLDRGAGTVINIASVLALAPELFNGVYSGTKAFVLNLSQSMQQEVGGKGIRVQAVLPGATRTEIWERAGVDMEEFPDGMLMGVEELVDAALAGLDQGETVTIPALPDAAEWEAFTAARLALGPNLSRDRAAARYSA